jgi:trigger factor
MSPEVDLGDYRKVRLEYQPAEVPQEDVNEYVESLRSRFASLEPVERTAQEGDLVYVRMKAEIRDESDESKRVLLEERRYPVIVDAADADVSEEWPFPGFSRGLIDLGPGQERELEYTFPEDIEIEDLRARTGVYSVRVEEVKSRTLPALDDEFAKSVGSYESLSELIEAAREALSSEAQSQAERDYGESLLDLVLEGATVKFPPQMVEHEQEHMLDDLNQELARQGLTMDIYLKSREIDLDGLKDEMREQAVRRIERGLVLAEIARSEGIQVPENVVEDRLEETVASIKEAFSPQDSRRLTTEAILQGLADRITSDEMVNLTLKRLIQIGRGEDLEAEQAAVENATPAEPD